MKSEAGVKTDRKLLFDREGKKRMRSYAKTRRRNDLSGISRAASAFFSKSGVVGLS